MAANARKRTRKRHVIVMTRSNAICPYPRLERAASCLARAGIRVLLVGWDRDQRFPELEKRGSITIRRVRIPGRYGGGIANLAGLAAFNVALVWTHLTVRPLAIHAVDLDTALPALLAKWFLRCRFIYDIADWYSASRRVGLLGPFADRVERWIVKRADHVIIAHEARARQIGFEPYPCTVIYNTPEDVLRAKQPAESEPYFAYVGVLHKDRGIDCLVKAAARAQVSLLIGGYGPLEGLCVAAARESRYIRFLGQIPYEQTLAIERGSEAILALYDPRLLNNRLAAPNKLYEAMMLGRPIITSAGTLAGELVEREQIGIVVRFGDPDELANAMRYLLEHRKRANEFGMRARRLYEERYSYETQCRKLLEAYRRLLPAIDCADSPVESVSESGC